MTRPEHMSKLMLRPVLASNTRFEVNSTEHGHYQLRPGGIVPGLHLGDIVDDDDVDVYVVVDDDEHTILRNTAMEQYQGPKTLETCDYQSDPVGKKRYKREKL